MKAGAQWRCPHCPAYFSKTLDGMKSHILFAHNKSDYGGASWVHHCFEIPHPSPGSLPPIFISRGDGATRPFAWDYRINL